MTPEALAALARLRRNFIVRSAEDLGRLREHQLSALDSKALHLVVHRLAGAAGTFGFSELSSAAEAAEYALLFEPRGLEVRLRALIAALTATVAREEPVI